jgi:hypothetical protein
MNLVKVYSTSVDNLKRTIVKFLRYGKSDVQTSMQAAPYGIDHNPIKDMIAIYGETAKNGDTVIVGYINKNAKAGEGELRLFSTDANGTEKMYLWLKANGTMELGGSADNVVKYTPLNSGLAAFQAQIQAQLVLIAAGIASAGGSYSPGTLNINISASKVAQLKTP